MVAWGGGNGKFLFDGYKSINCAKNVLKKCCAIMKIYLTLLNCTLKMVRVVNFMLWVLFCLYHNYKATHLHGGITRV